MKEYTETRWAVWNYKEKFFCGKNCWVAVYNPLAGKVPTFRTRDLAREAIQQMRSYKEESRPRKVTVTITAVDQ